MKLSLYKIYSGYGWIVKTALVLRWLRWTETTLKSMSGVRGSCFWAGTGLERWRSCAGREIKADGVALVIACQYDANRLPDKKSWEANVRIYPLACHLANLIFRMRS